MVPIIRQCLYTDTRTGESKILRSVSGNELIFSDSSSVSLEEFQEYFRLG